MVTRIEEPSSYNPITVFKGGTVRYTSVTKMEKKGNKIAPKIAPVKVFVT